MIVSVRVDIHTLTRLFMAIHHEGHAPQNMGDIVRATLCSVADALAPSQGPLTQQMILATIHQAQIGNRNTRTAQKLAFIEKIFSTPTNMQGPFSQPAPQAAPAESLINDALPASAFMLTDDQLGGS
jgi:hypothetical protein